MSACASLTVPRLSILLLLDFFQLWLIDDLHFWAPALEFVLKRCSLEIISLASRSTCILNRLQTSNHRPLVSTLPHHDIFTDPIYMDRYFVVVVELSDGQADMRCLEWQILVWLSLSGLGVRAISFANETQLRSTHHLLSISFETTLLISNLL